MSLIVLCNRSLYFLYVDVYLLYFGNTFKSSRSQVFFKIGVLKNFANFTGKHLCWSLLLIELQAWRSKETPTQVFSCKICDIFKSTFFYRTPSVAASILRLISRAIAGIFPLFKLQHAMIVNQTMNYCNL